MDCANLDLADKEEGSIMAALITVSPTGLTTIQPDGSDLPLIESLNEAIKILDAAKTATCHEALPIFSKVNSAHKYLCKQLTEFKTQPSGSTPAS
jgi:hypothetical protein